MSNPLEAIASFSRGGSVVAGFQSGTGPANSADFSQTLTAMMREAAGTIAAGEKTAIMGIQGEASVQQVVQSIMEAERSLNTMIAIRDKVVSAYVEISRMQI